MPSHGIIVLVETIPVWQSLQQLSKSKQVKGRAIIDITKENIPYFKESIKFAEVRHLENIKGSFSIADNKEYHGTALVQRSKPVLQIIISTVNSFVELQQHFFDTLWNQSIPASQKIKEIEEGVTPEFIRTITDPLEIKELQKNLLESAREEILTIFPNAGALNYQDKQDSIFKIIQEISCSNPALKARIIAPDDGHKIRETKQDPKQNNPKNIEMQYLTSNLNLQP